MMTGGAMKRPKEEGGGMCTNDTPPLPWLGPEV